MTGRRRDILWPLAVAGVLLAGASVALFARYGDRFAIPGELVALLQGAVSGSGSGNCPADLTELISARPSTRPPS